MTIIDSRELPSGSEIEADFIIVGGGMAGLTIARALGGARHRVAVLESGGRAMHAETQDLYRGRGVVSMADDADKPIDDYLHESRIRALGGSGHIWGGKSVPLDKADFEPREWLPRTGWPVTRQKLMPYYHRACDLLRVPRFDRDWNQEQEEGRPPLVMEGGRDFFSAPRAFSPVSGRVDPQRFAGFCEAAAMAPNVTVYLHANVVALQQTTRSTAVDRVKVASLNGKRHTARGRAYVLATGGIENARILLASELKPTNDWLGRCFMGHAVFGAFDKAQPRSLLTVTDAQRSLGLYTDNGRDRVHCVLAATLEGQRRLGIGNLTATMFPPDGKTEATTDAVGRLASLVDQQRLKEPGSTAVGTYLMSEQLPNQSSRIRLDGTRTDALGIPRVRLEWRYDERDVVNVMRGVAGFAAALGASHTGRLCWPLVRSALLKAWYPSRHHIGTTRMAARPENGVVDGNARMHGIRNLYVAGSSVFPTSGIANPTLTIVALAMRLADELKREWRMKR